MFTDSYLPYIRQIKDYHRYKAQGNIFLEDNIYFRRIDCHKLKKAIYNLLTEYKILKCNFSRLADGMIVIKELSQDCFDVHEINVPPEKENDFFHNIRLQNSTLDIEKSPLFKIYLNRFCDHIVLKIFVHHVLSDAKSLQYIKENLISLYEGADIENQYQFMDYAEDRNKYYFENLYDGYQYFKNHLGTKFVGELKSGLLEDKYYDRLLKLSVGNYYNPNDNYTKNGCIYHSMIRIENYETIHENMKQKGISWPLIAFASFSNLIQSYFGNNQFIGYIVADRFHKMSKNNIGEFTGEALFKAYHVSTTYQDLRKLYLSFFQKVKHLIFNYDLYSIREELFFRNACRSFFNFSIEEDIYIDNDKLNTYEKIDLIGLDLEPMFHFSLSRGLLYIRWRFNMLNISKKEMRRLHNDFEFDFMNKAKLLYPSEQLHP